MANKIRFKRGAKANLPALAVAEPGFCTDTGELFVGASGGNVQFPTKGYVDGELVKKINHRNKIFYISVSGNDSTGDGSSAKPYRTLDKILTEIASQRYPYSFAQIYFQDGGGVEFPIHNHHNLSGVELVFNSDMNTGTRPKIRFNSEINDVVLVCSRVGFVRLDLLINTSNTGGYAGAIAASHIAVFGGTISTVTEGSRFLRLADGISEATVQLSHSNLVGNFKLMCTFQNEIMRLGMFSVTKDASTCWVNERTELSQLTKVGSWYTV